MRGKGCGRGCGKGCEKGCGKGCRKGVNRGVGRSVEGVWDGVLGGQHRQHGSAGRRKVVGRMVWGCSKTLDGWKDRHCWGGYGIMSTRMDRRMDG
eukprot:364350-Chlamydomonas_euryale.AAC.8